jgi:hypothetical protein
VEKFFSERLGCDSEYKGDATCLALEATWEASLALSHKFPEGPKFTNYMVTNWGKYPSWETGTVANVSQDTMPPSANVLQGNGPVMWGVCEAIAVVLTQSPNQAMTGTCGWTASLGALSVRAPAKALKMAVRLAWTGRAAPNLEVTCDHVLTDQFPGLVPYMDGEENWVPAWAADMPYTNSSRVCSGGKADCLRGNGMPGTPAGLEGMWVQSLQSANLQYMGTACSPDGPPGLTWPGQDPDEAAIATSWQGVGSGQVFWTCNQLIDPVGHSCKLLFNYDTCSDLDNDTCYELATTSNASITEEGSDAWVVQKLAPVPSFTEELLREACSYEVALVTLDSGPLEGEPEGLTCNHAVALIDCDWEGDNYTVWTWGLRKYLNRSQILGTPVTLEEWAETRAAGGPANFSTFMDIGEAIYTRNPNNTIRMSNP